MLWRELLNASSKTTNIFNVNGQTKELKEEQNYNRYRIGTHIIVGGKYFIHPQLLLSLELLYGMSYDYSFSEVYSHSNNTKQRLAADSYDFGGDFGQRLLLSFLF